jgi:hypothetical protein
MADDLKLIADNVENFGDYALVGHDHDGRYALTAHEHFDYSPLGHTHDDVATQDHDHDTQYQPIGAYAAEGHDHDSDYVHIGDVGMANGIAPLDHMGLIPTAHLPALAISKPTVVASETAQLALTAEMGDVAIRTDLKKNFIHNGGTAGTMSDWSELQQATDLVTSVNGQQGTVVLGKADVGLGNVDNTSDANKPVSTAQSAAIAAKLDASQKGVANGVASLGSDGKVPAEQLPASTGGASGAAREVTVALVNPGFENGGTGWTLTSMSVTGSNPTGHSISPRTGSGIAVADAVANAYASQIVTLDAGDYADIDKGDVVGTFEVYASQTFTIPERAHYTITFLDAGDVDLNASLTTTYEGSAQNSWSKMLLEGTLPVGTRKIKFELRAQRLDGTNNNMAFDDVAATYTVPAAFLTDAPKDGKQYGRKDGTWAEIEAAAAAGSGGGGGLEEIIAIKTAAGGETSLFVDNIPDTYENLRIAVEMRHHTSGSEIEFFLRLNDDASAIYDINRHWGGSSDGRDHTANQTHWPKTLYANNGTDIRVPAEYNLLQYADDSVFTTLRGLGGPWFSGQLDMSFSGRYRSKNKVNKVSMYPLSGAIGAGSKMIVYGTKKENPTGGGGGTAGPPLVESSFTPKAHSTQNGGSKVVPYTADSDPDELLDATGNFFKPSKAGFYYVHPVLTAGSIRGIFIYKNGASYDGYTGGIVGATYSVASASLVYCDGVNDYFDVRSHANGVYSLSTGESPLRIVGPFQSSSGGGGDAAPPKHLVVEHTEPLGTEGGTLTAGAWETRKLNTKPSDTVGATLAADVITLPKGTYHVRGSVPFFRCNKAIARLYDVTNGAVLLYGSNVFADSDTAGSSDSSDLYGQITLAAATQIRLESRIETTKTSQGGGVAFNVGDVEHYSRLEFVSADAGVGSTNAIEASNTELWAGTAADKFISPGRMVAASLPVDLTDEGNITADLNTGINFKVTLAGNRTLANLANAQPGDSGIIIVTQDATGGRTLTYGTNWRFPGGAAAGGVLSTAPNAVDLLTYFVRGDNTIIATVTKDLKA